MEIQESSMTDPPAVIGDLKTKDDYRCEVRSHLEHL